jgi:tetratricopeptide (TPR) repeat protein/transcriptional regulator with XRE-family HTH domain
MKHARPSVVNLRLKDARKSRYWTQDQLAEQLGTTPHNVSRWECGVTSPSFYFCQKLCDLFALTPDQLGLTTATSGAPEAVPATSPALILATPTREAAPPLPLELSIAPPPAPGGLVGREDLLGALTVRLTGEHAPDVTALHGLPGAGKTALAAELAQLPALLERYPDGVLWAGLGPTPNVLGLLGAWGMALGLTPTEMLRLASAEVLGTVIRAAIGKRRFLLVIDDAWSLEDALAFKVGGPHCAHLVTTRYPGIALHLAGDGAIPVRELDEEQGLALLGRLAPQVVHDEADAARELIRSAGALPLALTLMGNYLRVQAHSGQPRRVQAALERLLDAEERLRLGEPRATAERSPSLPAGTPLSLRAAIAISDQRLDCTARSALRALAVFPAKPNSFSEEAALVVCDAPSETLDTLTDVGLLESAGPGRYTLHQTVSDYARLEETDPFAQRRMATYFMTLVQVHVADYQLLEREIANILVSFQAAAGHNMQEDLIRGALAFAPFARARGLYAVAEAHLVWAQQAAVKLNDDARRAHIALHLGRIAELRGDPTRAEQAFEQGVTFARAANDSATLAALLTQRGEVALNRGEYDQATLFLQEGLDLARHADSQPALAVLLRLLGEVTDCQGDAERATACYEEGLACARAAGDLESTSALLQNLGYKAVRRGDTALAEQLYHEGLTYARGIGHRQRISALLNNLGGLAFLARHYPAAEALYLESLELARLIEHPLRISSALQNLGVLERERGRPERAAAYLRESLEIARQIGNPLLTAETLVERAELELRESQLDAAATALDEALWLARRHGVSVFVGRALYNLARVAAARGRQTEAARLARESLTHFAAEDQDIADDVRRWLAALPATPAREKVGTRTSTAAAPLVTARGRAHR